MCGVNPVQGLYMFIVLCFDWFEFNGYLFCFSYLLGLLAKIKCSISSSQPDLWDSKQPAYYRRFRKIYETILPIKNKCVKFHCFILVMNTMDLSSSLAMTFPFFMSVCDLSIAVSLRVAGCKINCFWNI